MVITNLIYSKCQKTVCGLTLLPVSQSRVASWPQKTAHKRPHVLGCPLTQH